MSRPSLASRTCRGLRRAYVAMTASVPYQLSLATPSTDLELVRSDRDPTVHIIDGVGELQPKGFSIRGWKASALACDGRRWEFKCTSPLLMQVTARDESSAIAGSYRDHWRRRADFHWGERELELRCPTKSPLYVVTEGGRDIAIIDGRYGAERMKMTFADSEMRDTGFLLMATYVAFRLAEAARLRARV